MNVAPGSRLGWQGNSIVPACLRRNVQNIDMGRITIFNTISAVLIGALGAAIGAAFGREGVRWGIFVGGISGFVFPFYPVVFVVWIVERVKRRREHRQAGKQSDSHPRISRPFKVFLPPFF